MAVWDLWRDEKGKPSLSRVALIINLLFTGFLIVMDATGTWTVRVDVWVLQATIFTGLLAWAGGPRIAEHISKIGVGATGSLAKLGRRKGTDDHKQDDER